MTRRLSKLNERKYRVLNDVTIRTRNGSSQIDHVVVSVYGVFVIETKNYSGWIHGHENSEYWTQTIYKEKNQFRNPIKQNQSHIYALKRILPKNIPYYPIVVFAGSGELKNVYTEMPVIYSNQLIRTIKRITSPCLSEEEVIEISRKLRDTAQDDRVTRAEHNSHVQVAIRERQYKEATLVCPWCGSDLALRNGNYGKFYGCTGYPKCKFTRKWDS